MNNKSLKILEFPTNLGLRKKDRDAEPGVKMLPDWLKNLNFYRKIKVDKIVRLSPPAYVMNIEETTKILNLNEVYNYALNQSEVITKEIEDQNFLLIIGGDCSILIGTGLALKKLGNYGCFFLDGHTDFIDPEISQTGALAGMDLAIVTGNGDRKITNIDNLKPYIEENNVFCVGNREYDADYVAPILKSAINYFDLKNMRSLGAKHITTMFFDILKNKNLDGFFVHLDVDVLNDIIMPAVDSRANDGLSFKELEEFLEPLLPHKKCIGIEITILDPTLDPTALYTKNFIDVLSKIINKSLKTD